MTNEYSTCSIDRYRRAVCFGQLGNQRWFCVRAEACWIGVIYEAITPVQHDQQAIFANACFAELAANLVWVVVDQQQGDRDLARSRQIETANHSGYRYHLAVGGVTIEVGLHTCPMYPAGSGQGLCDQLFARRYIQVI